MKTPPVQLDHLHVFGLESGSTQSEKGGGSRYPLLGFTTPLVARMVGRAARGKPPGMSPTERHTGARTWGASPP